MNLTNFLILLLNTIWDLESNPTCPDCGGSLDSGMGFGNRDLECAGDFDPEDEDDEDCCCFAFTYPAEIYFLLDL